MTKERTALFVRLPQMTSQALEDFTKLSGRTKQAVVVELVEIGLDAKSTPTEKPEPASEEIQILDLDELSTLLRISVEELKSRLFEGDIPGRCISGNWRFSKQAVMRWMEGADRPTRARPGFSGSKGRTL